MDEPPKHPDVAAMFAALLEAADLNAAGLARKLDITPQAVSNYIVGRNEPGRKMIAAIIRAFPHVNASWLATGIGEPFPNGLHGTRVAATPAPTETPEPEPTGPAVVSLGAEANTDPYFHRYHALLDMVKTGFFGSPEQLLKKARASSDAASLYETVDAIAYEGQVTYQAPGFRQGVHRQLA